MSGVSLPVTRPVGRALVVASASARVGLVGLLSRLGFECGECDDPYTATMELCRRRLGYRALVLSLGSLYREELAVIGTVKQRFAHIEVWLAHTDGRQAALAESMRLGADGLVDDEGLHRIAAPAATVAYQPLVPEPRPAMPPRAGPVPAPVAEAVESADAASEENTNLGEPVLTAEELRALLQDPNDTAEKQA